jgi:hypothetical protein
MKNRKAMPHIDVKDKGSADLYFEFLEPKERKEFFDDLISDENPTIELPNFGKIENGPDISNQVKEINDKDLDKSDEEFIKRFVEEHRKPARPFLEYDEEAHKYKLKKKYDLERIVREFSKSR